MVAQSELDWIATAKKYLGTREIPGKPTNANISYWLKKLGAWWRDDETAWCGVFVGFCLKDAGVEIPKQWYRALAYKDDKRRLSAPCYGCVAVKSRQGGGHVCFVVGRDKKTGKLVCLGGNQGDSVSLALYDESVFDFYWYGKTSAPALTRYRLPEYNGKVSLGGKES